MEGLGKGCGGKGRRESREGLIKELYNLVCVGGKGVGKIGWVGRKEGGKKGR